MRQVGFDVLVIGSGTAGYTLALTCSKAGLKVAVVDSGSYGGTCGARGCEPEQYLAEAARVAQLSRQMSEIGVYPPGSVDWPALIRSKNAFTSGVPDRAERSLEQAGVAAFFGTARFISPAEVMIGEDTTVRARAVVIATGAHPAPLEFPGSELAISTDQFLELPMLPRRVLFIGGGCLSLSFAHVAHAAGAAVTVLQRGERILKRFDPELAGRVANSCHDLGIKIVTGANACMVERYRDAFITYGEAGCAEPFPSDIVVNTTGRFATLDRLDLASGGVTRSAHGVQVDEFLQSVSNPGVWAIGDACESPFQLSTVADMQGEVVAESIIKGKQRRPDYQGVPSVAYCQPPLAAVGLTQEQAANSGLSFRISRGDMASWPSSRRIGQRHAFYKVLIEAQTEKILGAHLFCHNAGEVINVFAMAMKFGLTTGDLQQVLWTYPTNVSDIKEMIS